MKRKGIIQLFLDKVEFLGNKLPSPSLMFFLLSLVVVIVSHLFQGITVQYFDAAQSGLREVTTNSLLTKEGVQFIFFNAIDNLTNFIPLGSVIIMMLGLGVLDESGIIYSLSKKISNKVSEIVLTVIVILLGVMSNVWGDTGYIILIPFAAVLFYNFKRNPITGAVAAFAGVAGGYGINIIVTEFDILFSEITNTALTLGGINYIITESSNIYFLIASTVMIVVLGTVITEKIISPRLDGYKKLIVLEDISYSQKEKNGLMVALIGSVAYFGVMYYLTYSQNAFLKNEAGLLTDFLNSGGFVVSLSIWFLLVGIYFGFFAGTIKNGNQLVNIMKRSLTSVAGYFVVVFFMAQFIAYFKYTNLSTILVVKSTDFVNNLGLQGIMMLLAFIILTSLLNLFVVSGIEKWAIMAPVFVPVLYHLGVTPDWTQIAFRIGDSATNIVSPFLTYFTIIILVFHKYKKEQDKPEGIGTFASIIIPYADIFFISWLILIILWGYLGLPIGY